MPTVTAVVSAAKTAYEADKRVKKYIPGGWKTVTISLILIFVGAPIAIVYAVFSSIDFRPSVPDFCVASTSTTVGDNDNHGGGNSGGGTIGGGVDTGFGRHSGPNVPFPTEDSDTIVYPVKGSVNSSSYGPRAPIRTGAGITNAFHDGADYSAPKGTPIVAMSDGIVSMSTNATGTKEGSMIEIQHRIKGKNWTTAYRHIIGSSIRFKVGDTVKAGQQIANVGSEGYSTGPHLHLVVAQGSYHRYNSTSGPAGTVSPIQFLSSNGAVNASGGLAGGDFSGVGSSKDTECGDAANSGRLQGDGTSQWNAFGNGQFEEEHLGGVGGVKLYADGAASLKTLLTAYKTSTGKELKINRGYLSLDEQKALYEAGKQIEKPGTSIFGWARIVEFSLSGTSSTEYRWLSENAAKYGFEQPEMFRSGASSQNPALWSFMGNGGMGTYPAAPNATAEENRQLAKKILDSDYPQWGSGENACLVNIWHRESGWNHKAANPTSSARGIPQAMMSIVFGSSWESSLGYMNFMNSPETQIRWGLDYIQGRYKTPCAAWEFWQETDPAKKGGIGGTWY